MKRKEVGAIPARRPGKVQGTRGGGMVTAQVWKDYLILDLWGGGEWKRRHVTDMGTGAYASMDPKGRWTGDCLVNAFGDYWNEPREGSLYISAEDKALADSVLRGHRTSGIDIFCRIISLERDYGRDYRRLKKERRMGRIRRLMDDIPPIGRDVYEWVEQAAAGTLQYAFFRKSGGAYHCTACGGDFTEKAAGVRPKHNGRVSCPLCGHGLAVDKRRGGVRRVVRLTVIHDVDGILGVERHFVVTVHWGAARTVSLEEVIRRILHRGGKKSRRPSDLYHKDYYGAWGDKNPRGHRWRTGYLYPHGITEGLGGTAYAGWKDVLPQVAAGGVEADYNRLLECSCDGLVRTVEYLHKGRFRRLLLELSELPDCRYGYSGSLLNLEGRTIGEVMGIRDRQKINRIRQEDGGMDMLEWMRWEDGTGGKIGGAVLSWYVAKRISCRRYRESRASKYLTPERLMHYLERQVAEYGGRGARTVFESYEDYLSMAEALGKDMGDEMAYRPRELKRRHDELAEEHRKHAEALRIKGDLERARKEAGRMREKYPGSEEVLAWIRSKYEYEGEEYMVTVPRNFLEITMEGVALHHCVGHTERYFDRILQHETYICFLRRKDAPGEPFYTIEVEPGGTIRQHRGMCDEEPGIEEIKPFLREWQKEVRRRMGADDHERARVSAAKRELNMEELRRKNNTRVLEALLEDLMEVG